MAGHYWTNVDGEYRRDEFPIPVVTVPGLCDIEVDLDRTGVTAKLPTPTAVALDCSPFAGTRFTVYGITDFLVDHKRVDEGPDVLASRLRDRDEAEVFFSFELPIDVPGHNWWAW